MLDQALSQLVTSAVAEGQRPIVGALDDIRAELVATRRELAELRAERHEAGSSPEMMYLSVAQVAEHLRVAQRSVKRWIKTGTLPHVRLPGGGIRVSVAELERVLHDNAGRTQEAAE